MAVRQQTRAASRGGAQNSAALIETGDVKLVGLDEPDEPPIFMVQPAMMDAVAIDFTETGARGVLPTRDGSDTFIHWRVALKGRAKHLVLTSAVGRDAVDDKGSEREFQLRVEVPRIGLSLVDATKHELLYASLHAVSGTIEALRDELRCGLAVGRGQVCLGALLTRTSNHPLPPPSSS